ncbi:MAG TPA: hypothetical protein VGP54_04750 [Gaiellaceae bacterium]|jgi:hypothetical protein|nr:hypothetical protein [Gaiellaceae bacterium]
MSRKRFLPLAVIVVAALVSAGIAAAGHHAPSVQSASAAFAATTVSNKLQVTCSVNGGDTFQATRATYTGLATSTDPRLAGALTIRAWSLVDTSNGVGHVFGEFRILGTGTRAHGTLNAAISGGKASGLARGFLRHRWGRLIASLGATFDPSAGFASGSLGSSTTGAGFIRSGRWCHPPHWPQS